MESLPDAKSAKFSFELAETPSNRVDSAAFAAVKLKIMPPTKRGVSVGSLDAAFF